MPIAVAQSLIPTAAQAPLDARTVIAALTDVSSIQNPYAGLEFYCTATAKKYRVLTLSSTTVGTRTVYVVGTYEALPDASDLTSLSGRVTSLESAVGGFESQAREILGVEEEEEESEE